MITSIHLDSFPKCFPDEISFVVLSYLQVNDLARASLACHKLNVLCSDPSFWKNRFLEVSDGWEPKQVPDSWKEFFKKIFFFEWCLWQNEKTARDHSFFQKMSFANIIRKPMSIELLDNYQFLKESKNEIYYFYFFCGGPQNFESIPMSDGIHDPSSYICSETPRNIIVRKSPKVNQHYLRFYTNNEQSENQRYGIGDIRFMPGSTFSSELTDLVYSFRTRIFGLASEDCVLISNGIVKNRLVYEKVKRLIQKALEQQRFLK